MPGSLENLSDMPGNPVLSRVIRRRPNGLAVEGNYPLLKAAGAGGGFGDDDKHGVGECEDTSIEKFVVQSAEREPVALFVRSAGLMPFDMRGFQGDRDGSESDIEAADCAAALVGAQNAVAEIGAPRDDDPGFDANSMPMASRMS